MATLLAIASDAGDLNSTHAVDPGLDPDGSTRPELGRY